MQTHLADFIKDSQSGQEAEAILRKCTHCGFCLPACPTYRLLGDERDSPRGRIYQVQQVLEGATPSESIQRHLDRCLTCRACETACPAGVEYARLADLGRQLVETRVPRHGSDLWKRRLLRGFLSRPRLFGLVLGLGRTIRPLLPSRLRAKVPLRRRAQPWPTGRQARKVLMLEGCVQPALEPSINSQTAQLLNSLGMEVVRTPSVACCGAIDQHLGGQDKARAHARRNIDAWWPHLEAGAEAVIVNASGCAAQVRDYGHLLSGDAEYAERARRVSGMARDPVEILEYHIDRLARAEATPKRLAFHAPCTLQHALRLQDHIEAVLRCLGFELTPVADPHICCGSAGTYSILQPRLGQKLRRQKQEALLSGSPEIIATANIGCLVHLNETSEVPVRHWLDLIAVRN